MVDYLVVNFLQGTLGTLRSRANCSSITLYKGPRWVHVKPKKTSMRMSYESLLPKRLTGEG